jgi:RimJ/RimL family protein N-acetyltransferase
MLAELAARYEVHAFSAVLKAGNHRSMRLLERLGFNVASPEFAAEIQVEADEVFMLRGATP